MSKARSVVTNWNGPVAGFVILFSATVAITIWRGQNVHWGGFIALLVSYALVYFVGFAAADAKGTSFEDMVLAKRSLPIWIGAFTMAATWIDGGYINGSAEYAYKEGLVWVQAPWCYALSLIIGGIFYAPKMRRCEFVTMLDALECRYGKRLTACMYGASLLGDIFWSGAILTALGTTFGTILGLDFTVSILLSAAISIACTMAGGMWSVAFTNVVQLAIILIGLFVVLALVLPSAGGLASVIEIYQRGMGDKAALLPPIDGWRNPSWGNHYWEWWDRALLLILGGIPWQGYFQRVLSAKNERVATGLSIVAGGICIVVAIPSILIGMVGYSVDWNRFGTVAPENASMILPHVLRYMTPQMIGAVGLGAVAAAVMSSVASSVLASSSMAAWNIYRPLLKPGAEAKELARIVKLSVLLIGSGATIIALNSRSVYALWVLCADLVYCLLFPQLTTALFFKRANRYGAVAGAVVSFVLRAGGGEPTLGIPPFIGYPMIDNGVVLFPFRTLAMVSGLLTIVVVSLLTQRACPPQPLPERSGQAS